MMHTTKPLTSYILGWVDPEEKYKMYANETMPRALQNNPKRIVSTKSQSDARVANGFSS